MRRYEEKNVFRCRFKIVYFVVRLGVAAYFRAECVCERSSGVRKWRDAKSSFIGLTGGAGNIYMSNYDTEVITNNKLNKTNVVFRVTYQISWSAPRKLGIRWTTLGVHFISNSCSFFSQHNADFLRIRWNCVYIA